MRLLRRLRLLPREEIVVVGAAIGAPLQMGRQAIDSDLVHHQFPGQERQQFQRYPGAFDGGEFPAALVFRNADPSQVGAQPREKSEADIAGNRERALPFFLDQVDQSRLVIVGIESGGKDGGRSQGEGRQPPRVRMFGQQGSCAQARVRCATRCRCSTS